MPTFTARIEKNWIMRCVIVPAAVLRELGDEKRISVVAEYAGEKVETTVMPAGKGRGRLTVLMDILRPRCLDVGDELKVSLKRATNSREPTVPPDLQRALQFRPVAKKEFVEGPPFQRRWIAKFLDDAKHAETRRARLEVVLERLAERANKRKARA